MYVGREGGREGEMEGLVINLHKMKYIIL